MAMSAAMIGAMGATAIGCRMPKSEQLAPTNGQIAPTSSKLAPTSSQLAPTNGQLAPTSSQLAPTNGQLAPTARVHSPRAWNAREPHAALGPPPAVTAPPQRHHD